MSESKWRIVSKEQVTQGYLTCAGGQILRHAYLVLEKRPDGTYMVVDPPAPTEPD